MLQFDKALIEEETGTTSEVGKRQPERAAPEQARAANSASYVTRPDTPASLNEVGVMSELARLRAKR
jgi:hypothetical protein